MHSCFLSTVNYKGAWCSLGRVAIRRCWHVIWKPDIHSSRWWAFCLLQITEKPLGCRSGEWQKKPDGNCVLETRLLVFLHNLDKTANPQAVSEDLKIETLLNHSIEFCWNNYLITMRRVNGKNKMRWGRVKSPGWLGQVSQLWYCVEPVMPFHNQIMSTGSKTWSSG